MPRRKHVSAIALIVALPASADTVFDGVGAAAAAGDDVVDGRLIGGGVITEKCGAAAPVTPLVCVQPQDRTSGQLVSGCLSYRALFQSGVVEVCVEKPSLWRLGGGESDVVCGGRGAPCARGALTAYTRIVFAFAHPRGSGLGCAGRCAGSAERAPIRALGSR